MYLSTAQLVTSQIHSEHHATSPHRWIETHIYGGNIGGSDVTDAFETSRNLSSLQSELTLVVETARDMEMVCKVRSGLRRGSIRLYHCNQDTPCFGGHQSFSYSILETELYTLRLSKNLVRILKPIQELKAVQLQLNLKKIEKSPILTMKTYIGTYQITIGGKPLVRNYSYIQLPFLERISP